MIDGRFRKADDEYFRLKGQLGTGRLTQEQFEAAIKDQMVQDAEDHWWMQGVESGLGVAFGANLYLFVRQALLRPQTAPATSSNSLPKKNISRVSSKPTNPPR